MVSQKISLSYLAPLAKESNIIDPGRLGTLRSWEEERYGRHIRELCGPEGKKGQRVSRDRNKDATEKKIVMGKGTYFNGYSPTSRPTAISNSWRGSLS
jgi:hypothetical protein